MDEKQAMHLVEQALGIQPISAVHQPFGHYNVTYEVMLPERSVMVRMNRNASAFATTEANILRLTALGLPLPKLLAVDLSLRQVPFSYMILDKIPGRDLRYELGAMRPEQMTRLAERIVEFQRQVGQLPPGKGYGYVGIGESGPYRSWWDLLAAESSLEETKVPGIPPLRLRAQKQRQRFEAYLRSVPPTCFLDDITVKNVIVQDSKLQGLIDFDCVCYGDPLYWLALTAVGVVSDVGTHGLFYVEELQRLWSLSTAEKPILALYSAEIAVDFLRRHSLSETPAWNTRMHAAAEQWLQEAEQSATTF